jgi:HK97 family phage major capsid protein
MSMIHSTTADSFTPQDIGGLVDLAVKAQSIAARSATVFGTDKFKVSFPKWTADPSVAFYNELDTIAATDGTTDEVPALVYKTAGITRISNELRDDSSPAIGDLVGGALSNQISRAIDGAYLANTTAKAPDGLLAQSYTTVDTGASLTNLDPFIAARFASVAAGSELTHWIVKPAVAEALSKLKKISGSAENLIAFVEDGLVVAGLPVLISNQLDANTLFWGIPQKHVVLVMRNGTTVERFPAVYNDGTDIRAISRFGLAFLNEPGVIRGYDAA